MIFSRMCGFRDLFVAQVLGNLMSRHYTGMVSFAFEERIPTSVWLGENSITHAQHKNEIGIDPLYEILWNTKGRVGLYSQVPVPENTPPFDFPDIIEVAIDKIPSAPLASCPMLEKSYLLRGELLDAGQSDLVEQSHSLLKKITIHGVGFSADNFTLDESEFWPAVLFLCSTGQALCSYELTLGRILKEFQNDLLARLTKLLGKKVIDSFTKTVQEELKTIWPDWSEGKPADSLYGTEPYNRWAKTVKEKSSTLGIPTLVNRAFDQALSNIPATDARIVADLSES